jgi:hypothetical protein
MPQTKAAKLTKAPRPDVDLSRYQRTRWTKAGLPIETPEQRQAVSALVRPGRPLEQVALTLYVRGYPIEDCGLRAAYGWAFSELIALIDANAPLDAAPFERAEAFALELKRSQSRNPMFRAMKKALKGATETPDGILTSALIYVILALRDGEPIPEEPARELAAAAGAVDLPEQTAQVRAIKPEYQDEFSTDLGGMLAQFSFHTLAELAASRPREELDRARDELASFVLIPAEVAELFPPLGKVEVDDTDPIALAILVPALIVMRRLAGDRLYDGIIAWTRTLSRRPRNPNWGGRRRLGPVGQPGGGIHQDNPT